MSFVIPGDVYAYDDFDDYGDDMTSGRQAQVLKLAGVVSMDGYLTVSTPVRARANSRADLT